MRLKLDFGRNGLEVQIPDYNLEAVLGLRDAPAHYYPERGVRDALRRPIGCPPFPAFARGRESACIVISDITRPVPNRLILPQIMAVLDVCGVPRDRTTVLVATGTHRGNTRGELIEMVGESILADYPVVNHDARDLSTHRHLGESTNGVPIWVDTRFLDADLKLSVALIEPHFMAGFSGGRKNICPGICAMETVAVWHGPRFIGHENASMGVVACNPVHEEALEIALKAGLEFICDVTINEDREVTNVWAGDPRAAWMSGVNAVRQVVEAPLAAPADIVVTTTAGYPLDLTFYQAVKGMVGALPAVKPGGTIILASECAEGLGSAHFAETLLATEDLAAFVEQTRQPGFFIPDQWEIHELHKAVSHAEVMVHARGIPPEVLQRCFVTPIASVEEGIQRAMERHGPTARIVAIPRGPYVIPLVR